MTLEVKQRIEQIGCGEVPIGYAKTTLGLLLPIGNGIPLAISILKGKSLGVKNYRF